MERLTDRFDGQAILICENETCKIYGDGMCSSANPCYMEQNMIDRLAAYEDAEEAGLFVRLPCKLGDTVYAVDWKTIRRIEVESISITKIATFIRGKYVEAGIVSYISGTFGNSIFLTREEAEAALAAESLFREV